MHLVGCRMYWLAEFLGEDGGEETKAYGGWNEAALTLGAPVPPPAALVRALDRTWRLMSDCLARWGPAELQQTFPDN
jgi:hypothetical protein